MYHKIAGLQQKVDRLQSLVDGRSVASPAGAGLLLVFVLWPPPMTWWCRRLLLCLMHFSWHLRHISVQGIVDRPHTSC